MVQGNKSAAPQEVEGKEACRHFAPSENKKFPDTKRKQFFPGTLTHRKHYQNIAIFFKRSLCEDHCVSVVHYQNSDNGLEICLVFKLLDWIII